MPPTASNLDQYLHASPSRVMEWQYRTRIPRLPLMQTGPFITHLPLPPRCCRAAAALAVLAALAGCGKKPTPAKPAPEVAAPAAAAESPSQWPMARGGRQLQGRVAAPAPRQATLEWTFQSPSAITSEAAVAAGVAVFGDVEGVVRAVDLATRKERWQVTTEDTVQATPAIADGRVFIGSDDGVFRALDLRDGKELWTLKGDEKFPTGAALVDSPDGANTWLLVNGYDGRSHCLRARDGESVWQHQTEDYINGTPVVLAGGLVAFGGCDATIHFLQLKDGTAVHSVTSEAQIINSLTAWEDTVYGVNHANQLFAAAATAAEPAWLYEADGAQFLTSPAVDETMVYVGSRDKHLHAVDRLTGKVRWKFKTAGRVASAPLVFEDAVVFGSSDGRLYAVDKREGRELWQLDLGEELAVAPAFAGGRIILGGGDGSLFVIRGGATP